MNGNGNKKGMGTKTESREGMAIETEMGMM